MKSMYLKILFFLGVVGLGGFPGIAATVQDGRLSVFPWPDRVLYEPGAAAKFEVRLWNRTKEPFQGTLRVTASWEMEDAKILQEQPLTLAAGEDKTVTAEWTDLPEVLGCEVRAELRGADGTVRGAGREFFNVCKHMDSLRVGIHSTPAGLLTYGDEKAIAGLKKAAWQYRANYVNIGEYFAQGRSGVLELAPPDDIPDEFPGGDYWSSKRGLKTAIAEAHKYGMKAVVYVTSYTTHGLADLDISARHPEWLLYNEFGQPDNCAVDAKREDEQRHPEYRKNSSPGPFISCNLNWLNAELLDYHADQLIANKKFYGMDGVRYDGHPFSAFTVGARDITGKAIPHPPSPEWVEIHNRGLRHIKARVRQACPDYLFMFNGGSARQLYSPPALDAVLAPYNQATFENGGALCDEEGRGAYTAVNPYNNWERYTVNMINNVDLARQTGGQAYFLFPWASNIHVNSDDLGYSILLAAGNHPWFAQPSYGYGTDHYPVQKELFAFATRYSAFLWGKGIDRIRDAATVVEVTSATGSIWWKNFVHRRSLPDGRRFLMVHLLNAPPTPGMGVIEQPLPEPVEKVKLAFKAPIKTAWAATARPGTPAADGLNWIRQSTVGQAGATEKFENFTPPQTEKLAVTDGIAILPRLRVWTMVVAELK